MELSLETIRYVALTTAALAMVAMVIRARAVLRALSTFFFEPGSAAGLALMRISIFWMLWEASDADSIVHLAGLPVALRTLPYGWVWLRDVIPFDPDSARRITLAFAVASGFAVVGLFTRLATPISALLAVYVLGIPNFFAKIDHGAHATVLCALILAASPCGDALSFDRLWRLSRGQAAPPPAAAYNLPLRFCFLILGTVYLFPGLWKLWKGGDLWISGVQLTALLEEQWAQLPDFVPLFRPDESPFLMKVLGTATLLFEIGFIFMLFNRWTRVLAAFSAVLFHLSVFALMGIRFNAFLPLVLLFDLPGLPAAILSLWPAQSRRLVQMANNLRVRGEAQWTRWFKPRAQWQTAAARTWFPAALVGATLVTAQTVAGFALIDSWPIAVHPRFDRRTPHGPSTGQRLAVVVDRASGAPSIDLRNALDGLGQARGLRVVQSLNRLARDAQDAADAAEAEAAIIDFLRQNRVELEVGDRVSFLRKRWDLFPLGQYAGMKTTVLRRFEVTPDFHLGAQTNRWKHRYRMGKKKKQTIP